MRTQLRSWIITAIAAAALLPMAASADGLMVPPPNYEVYETGQEAAIFFENGHQEMWLSASFRGDAENFAWIVPTPNIPEVERGSWEMFVALRGITTATTDDYRVSGYGSTGSFALEDYAAEPAVVELERTSVGYYDIVVLEARTTEGLLEWFDENGFTYPSDGEYILDEYIDAGWYFTAMTLNTEGLSASAAGDVRRGDSLPLRFSFDTDKMVFPMQLSQVARLYTTGTDGDDTPKLKDTVDVTLYLISETRRTLPGFTQRYAGYISGEAISQLSYGTNGEPVISADTDKQYVVTRLSRAFPVTEMTYDLYPREAENIGVLNDGGGVASNGVLLITILGGIITLILIGAIVVMARDNDKKK